MATPQDINGGLTAKKLRKLLRYDQCSGKFFSLRRINQVKEGDECGWLSPISGYLVIKVSGRKYLAHRLAWLYVKGFWPKDRLDHRNGLRSDNRFKNLREATDQQNSGNKKFRKDSVLGIKGVRLHETGRFQARIGIYGTTRSKHLGLFDSKELAQAAYAKAAYRRYGKFARPL